MCSGQAADSASCYMLQRSLVWLSDHPAAAACESPHIPSVRSGIMHEQPRLMPAAHFGACHLAWFCLTVLLVVMNMQGSQ